MSELSQLLVDAFNEIWPKLKNDPDELARRLARRRTPALMKPLRAFCLAVRASDHRINPASARIVPEDAAYPREQIAPDLRPYYQPSEHTVTLDAPLLRRLCRPVTITPPGMDWRDVATMLGVDAASLRWAMNAGVFEVVRIPGLGGKFGKPVPRLYSSRTFDPSAASLRAPPDPIWGAAWQGLADHVPADLEQTLTRVPVYYGDSRRDAYFRRWLWQCPACGKRVRTVYYPLAPMTLTKFYGIDPAKLDADEIPGPPPCFACHACHRVRFFSRIDPGVWNCVVSYLSGGLMYGQEVKRPAWLTKHRKREYVARLNRAPSRRREQILERICRGWSYPRIGLDLGLSRHTVGWYAWQLLRQYGLHSREELEARFARLNPCQPSRKRDQAEAA